MTKDTQIPSHRGMKRWQRVLLVVSLSLNLLIIGAVAGIAITGGPRHHGPHAKASNMAFGPLTHALNHKDRRAIMGSLLRSDKPGGWNKREHHEAMQSMVTLLSTTPFDPSAFEAELERTMSGVQSRLGDARMALVRHISEMTDEERAAYAMRVKDILERRKP